ncbi:DNA mismatch repair protein MutS2 [Arcticibacter tournemirensis]|uniref:Endonuclease MutS2 n=1 Tax=Arcticibacter tournemirensis TaxID=699437 RepID=A0A5M9HIR0_9SPHI|nr:endonuclease MutS2 [Arcticibacter tournemirensis]KAA8485331.1 endonuclease MutS2 [Arcticibacter tournemirensis]TQM50384.1 DNA mismatch repair protein MutS2 [Arcticibacter tournemirensis]
MIYPQNALDKLGFTEIKSLIKSHCLSDMGVQMVDRMQLMTSYENINKFLRQTREFKEILENDSPLPIRHLFDIKSLAEKIRVEGAFLSEAEFHQVLLSLQTVFSVISYFNEREGRYPNLEALFEHLQIEKKIIKSIEFVIDEKGKIRPNASPELQNIISGIAKAEQEARKRIDHIFKNAQNSGWTADGSLTIRDGRICIPLLAENKRKIKGFVHDESASGQTVYLEPEEVFQLNNQVRDLEFEKRREIVKILTALSSELRPYVPLLLSYHGLLTKLDFVRAKAMFAIETEGDMPQLSTQPELRLVNARHPLLFLNLKKEGQTVVPLNISIDEQQRIIVVSGPNAGGKSVCMKTVGLLQIMVQAGLLIPVDESSKVGIFKQIFADIGDDQSIESDLSTYSAHLSKMKYFVENSGGKTLILIDEFGTGTDPQFGGPIAEAVLETLNRKRVRGVITTHYSNLKVFANAAEGLENASMMFNNLEMQPLYILEMGKPGSSYAFEIAQKIGLPPHVLNAAKSKIGVHQKRVDTLLVDLERDKKELLETRVAVEKQQRRVNMLMEENEKLKSYLEENRKAILKDAKKEAQSIILNANKLVENTISEIKQNKADKEHTQQLRQNLRKELEKHAEKKEVPAQTIEAAPTELAAGDWVKLTDSETIGQIIDVTKENVILAIGDLRSVVKRKRVQKIAKKEVPKEIRRSYSSGITEDLAQFRPEIDIRGMRGEEALYEIEKYLDKALMMGFSNLRIIHGKGDGILRKLVRDYLRKYSHVSRMEDEHPDRGGDGITNVYL